MGDTEAQRAQKNFFMMLDNLDLYRREHIKDLIKDQARTARTLAERLNSYADRLEATKPGDYLPTNEADSGLVRTLNLGDGEIRALSDTIAREAERTKQLRELFQS